jgi:hypothetical protein
MGKIKVESKPFSTIQNYSGTYTTDVSDDLDEYRQGTFEFTVAHTTEHDTGFYETEVIWLDEQPANIELANEYVKNLFYAAIGIE